MLPFAVNNLDRKQLASHRSLPSSVLGVFFEEKTSLNKIKRQPKTTQRKHRTFVFIIWLKVSKFDVHLLGIAYPSILSKPFTSLIHNMGVILQYYLILSSGLLWQCPHCDPSEWPLTDLFYSHPPYLLSHWFFITSYSCIYRKWRDFLPCIVCFVPVVPTFICRNDWQNYSGNQSPPFVLTLCDKAAVVLD